MAVRYLPVAVLALLILPRAVVAEGDSARAIHRSDVVFMYDNPAMYEPYGCTVLGWAGRPDREHIARARENGVRLFSVSVGFRTEFQGMIDFSEEFLDAACRNFAGEPFIVPWLWDHKHKGQPAWHFCTNAPLFQEFLYSRLQQLMNSPLGAGSLLVIAPQLSYFCCEIGHAANSRRSPSHPIYIYKLADGVDRPVTATASGHDWAYVSEHNLTGLIRHWAALSYAHGHMLMAPHRQWCYTEEKGTHWANFPPEELAWVYRFVREHAHLLDRYEAVAPIGLVYDAAAHRHDDAGVRSIGTALAERNVPFTIVVAGDDWLPDYRLTAEKLAGFLAVVVPKDLAMDLQQKALIDAVDAEGRLVSWPDDAKLQTLAPVPVAVEGAEHVAVVPRAIPGDPASPVAIHLLNRRYDGQTDSMVPQQHFTVRLRADLFPGRKFSHATLHAPREESEPCALRVEGESIELTVPRLDLWAIVELTPVK